MERGRAGALDLLEHGLDAQIAQGEPRRVNARVAVDDAPDLRFAQPSFGAPVGIAFVEPAIRVFAAIRPVKDLAEQDGGFVVAVKQADKSSRTQDQRLVAVAFAQQEEDVFAETRGGFSCGSAIQHPSCK